MSKKKQTRLEEQKRDSISQDDLTVVEVQTAAINMLRHLTELIESISKQHIGQRTDYEVVLAEFNRLEAAIVQLNTLVKTRQDIGEDLENMSLLQLHALQSYKLIAEGLARKANRSGKYSMRNYRRDMKSYEDTRALLWQAAAQLDLDIMK